MKAFVVGDLLEVARVQAKCFQADASPQGIDGKEQPVGPFTVVRIIEQAEGRSIGHAEVAEIAFRRMTVLAEVAAGGRKAEPDPVAEIFIGRGEFGDPGVVERVEVAAQVGVVRALFGLQKVLPLREHRDAERGHQNGNHSNGGGVHRCRGWVAAVLRVLRDAVEAKRGRRATGRN